MEEEEEKEEEEHHDFIQNPKIKAHTSVRPRNHGVYYL